MRNNKINKKNIRIQSLRERSPNDRIQVMKARPIILLLNCPDTSPAYVGIQKVAKRENWQLLIRSCELDLLGKWRGDGVIVNSDGSRAMAKATARLSKAGVRVVDLSDGDEPDVFRVIPDSETIGRIGAEHFLSKGFSNLAYFSSIPCRGARTMESAFHHTAKNAVFRSLTPAHPTDFLDAKAFTRELADQVESAPKPLGVLCRCDADAMLVINACMARGIAIPDDVSILGVGNDEAICERECVPLSSVRLNDRVFGSAAAELMCSILHRRTSAAKTLRIAPIDIVERQTTDALGTGDPLLKAAFSTILGNIRNPMGAADIAVRLHVGRTRLDRTFSSILGRSVGSEIKRQRIIRAKGLLATTNWPVRRIALETGFCNAAYFIASFKQTTGSTPLSWRKHSRSTILQ